MIKYRARDGIIEYKGVRLPNLTANTAIEYHNACIAYLIELSNHPEHMQDEDLLAAAVILRYYEVLDTSINGEDESRSLRAFHSFMTSQAITIYSMPTSSRDASPSCNLSLDDNRTSHKNLFSYAALTLALRLEVASGFIQQRPVSLPLNIWMSQRSFDEAEDVVWVTRLILYCADVLQFCFGNETGDSIGKGRPERWKELKEFEDLWEFHKPPSFTSIKYQEPDQEKGQVFPWIWYMSDYQVLGVQYLDLARILLTVYNPNIPLIGLSAAAASRRTSATVREIVLRILGSATSSQDMIPAQIAAHLAIAVCGHYFTKKNEQNSIINILLELDEIHAWPTAKTIAELREAWSQVDESENETY